MRAQRWALVAAVMLPSMVRADHEGHTPVAARVDPQDPDRIMVGYSRRGGGVLLSTDGGVVWSMVCSAAIAPELEGHSGSALSGWQIAGDGQMIVGHFDGIHESPDGCDWKEQDPLDGRWIPDITRDPVDSDVFYAIGGRTLDNEANEQEGTVFRRSEGSWNPVGDPLSLSPGKLLVADLGKGKRRLYMSAVNGFTEETFFDAPIDVPRYVVRYSDDDGDSWTEFVVPNTAPLSFYIVAVDPSDPDRLLALISGGFAATDRLLLSTDRGETFEEFDVLERFGAAVFAPDGRLWWGGLVDGLWRADSVLHDKVEVNSAALVYCLEYLGGDELLMCQPRDVGRIDGLGGNYEMLLDITFLDRTLICGDATTTCTKCVPALRDHYCTSVGFEDAPICALCADNCDTVASMKQGEPIVEECRQVVPHSILTRQAVADGGLPVGEGEADRETEPEAGTDDEAFDRGGACACGALTGDHSRRPPTPAAAATLLIGVLTLWRYRRRRQPATSGSTS